MGWAGKDRASKNEVGTAKRKERERDGREEPTLLRERPGPRSDFQPRRLRPSSDLPSRAKPLINAFAKKLHAVGGKQEQEGVGRARSDTRETKRSRFSASLPRLTLPFPSRSRARARAIRHLVYFHSGEPGSPSLHAERANLRGQFDRDSGPDSTRALAVASLRLEIARDPSLGSPIARFRPVGPIFVYSFYMFVF